MDSHDTQTTRHRLTVLLQWFAGYFLLSRVFGRNLHSVVPPLLVSFAREFVNGRVRYIERSKANWSSFCINCSLKVTFVHVSSDATICASAADFRAHWSPRIATYRVNKQRVSYCAIMLLVLRSPDTWHCGAQIHGIETRLLIVGNG